jgi:hypothetical protein
VDPLGLEEWQWNHLLPKAFFEDDPKSGGPRYEIEGLNVDKNGNPIDDWQSAERGRVMSRSDHIGKGGGKQTHIDYNDMWGRFLQEPDNRKKQKILEQLRKITDAEPGSDLYKYREWLDKGVQTDMSYKQWGSCTDVNKGKKLKYIAMLEEALQNGKFGGGGSPGLNLISKVVKTSVGKVVVVISLISATSDLVSGAPVIEVIYDQVLPVSVNDLREFQQEVERVSDAWTDVGHGNNLVRRDRSTVAPGAGPNDYKKLPGEQ